MFYRLGKGSVQQWDTHQNNKIKGRREVEGERHSMKRESISPVAFRIGSGQAVAFRRSSDKVPDESRLWSL